MSGFYIGVDGKARKVKGGYIGIDGKARKIKKGYIGDENGIARLCWSGIDPVFANNTWEEIAIACQTGAVPDSWAVGDQKTMTIGDKDYTIDIIGKNHDDYADGSGKAPLTFQLHDCYNTTTYKMNSSQSNNGGWNSCYMKKYYLPEILDLMPNEVNSAIRDVTKLTSQGLQSSNIVSTVDKLFLLSEIEVLNTNGISYEGEGIQYAYYANGGSKAKCKIDTTNSINWWLRSPVVDSTSRFALVNSNGSDTAQSDSNNTYPGVSFAFCF